MNIRFLISTSLVNSFCNSARFSSRLTLIAAVVTSLPAIGISQERVVGSHRDPSQTSSTKYVMTTVTVTDRHGRYVSGLRRDSFVVLDEKTPQQIVFFSDKDVPISVGILMDTRLSIRIEPHRVEQSSIKQVYIQDKHS